MKTTRHLLPLLIVLTISGCKTLNQDFKEFMADAAVSPQQRQAIEMERQKEEEIQNSINAVIATFQNSYPITIREVEAFLNDEEYAEFKSGAEQGYLKHKQKLDRFDVTAKEIYRIHLDGVEISKTASLSINFIDSEIERASSHPEFEQRFYAKNEKYAEYRNWLTSVRDDFRNLQKVSYEMGIEIESNAFLASARKQGCTEVETVGYLQYPSHLAQIMTYNGERLSTKVVYDLTDFIVLQNARGGALLTPSYSHVPRLNTVFLSTDKIYADGTGFQQGEQPVCFNGNLKQYSSILGANRTVNEIIPVNVSDDYYFLPY